MKYKGIELKEFTSDKPVVFDPPKTMLCWNTTDPEPFKRTVLAYIPRTFHSVITNFDEYTACAEIPEVSPRLVNHRELAKWLAQGNGEWKKASEDFPRRRAYFDYTDDLEPLQNVLVRKWVDEDWRDPTADYMGLEAK